jgi:aminoglycoside phosphotransferase (APT) family kinase protein
MDRYTATLSGPIGLSASHSAHPGVVSLWNQISLARHAIQIAATAHAASAPRTSSILLFLLPVLAMCAVRVPLPEALFNSDFRTRLGSMFSEHHAIADLTIQPMRRRPGSRHVFSYKLLVADKRTGKHNVVELVGKQDTTRAVGKAAKEFEAMRLLWGAGFGQDNRFRIPQPLHHFEDLRMIIQEKARGTKLRTFLGDGSYASFNHARMTGLWLAKLHNMPVDSTRECGYESEKASLWMFVEALKNDQPQLETELRQYAAAVEQRFDSFQGVQATHVHGDFHPDHVYVANNFVTVIDFERFCIGDPARDLGSFVGHMRTTGYTLEKSIEFVDKEIGAFLESYFSGVSEAQGNAINARVAPYAALSSFEALYYVASVLKVTNAARVAMYMQCLRESGVPPIGMASRGTDARTFSA